MSFFGLFGDDDETPTPAQPTPTRGLFDEGPEKAPEGLGLFPLLAFGALSGLAGESPTRIAGASSRLARGLPATGSGFGEVGAEKAIDARAKRRLDKRRQNALTGLAKISDRIAKHDDLVALKKNEKAEKGDFLALAKDLTRAELIVENPDASPEEIEESVNFILSDDVMRAALFRDGIIPHRFKPEVEEFAAQEQARQEAQRKARISGTGQTFGDLTATDRAIFEKLNMGKPSQRLGAVRDQHQSPPIDSQDDFGRILNDKAKTRAAIGGGNPPALNALHQEIGRSGQPLPEALSPLGVSPEKLQRLQELEAFARDTSPADQTLPGVPAQGRGFLQKANIEGRFVDPLNPQAALTDAQREQLTQFRDQFLEERGAALGKELPGETLAPEQLGAYVDSTTIGASDDVRRELKEMALNAGIKTTGEANKFLDRAQKNITQIMSDEAKTNRITLRDQKTLSRQKVLAGIKLDNVKALRQFETNEDIRKAVTIDQKTRGSKLELLGTKLDAAAANIETQQQAATLRSLMNNLVKLKGIDAKTAIGAAKQFEKLESGLAKEAYEAFLQQGLISPADIIDELNKAGAEGKNDKQAMMEVLEGLRVRAQGRSASELALAIQEKFPGKHKIQVDLVEAAIKRRKDNGLNTAPLREYLQRIGAKQAAAKTGDPFAPDRAAIAAMKSAAVNSEIAVMDELGNINIRAMFDREAKDTENYLEFLRAAIRGNPLLAKPLNPRIAVIEDMHKRVQRTKREMAEAQQSLPVIRSNESVGNPNNDAKKDKNLSDLVESLNKRIAGGEHDAIEDVYIDGKHVGELHMDRLTQKTAIRIIDKAKPQIFSLEGLGPKGTWVHLRAE